MMTLSGALITQEDGNPTVPDIARGLARMPRFAGQTLVPWSVAEHSLVVEAIIGAMFQNLKWLPPETTLYGLLHDAHEMMTGDIPTTFKTEDMRRLQWRLDARLYKGLGISLPTVALRKAVKDADNEALLAEARVVASPANYVHICEERRAFAFDPYVQIVRDVLQSTEQPEFAFARHVERGLLLWGRKVAA
jgi:hypothetical protein